MGVAHHALGHAFGVDAGHSRQRLRHLQTRHTHAKAARDQLEVHQPLVQRQQIPLRAQHVGQGLSGQLAQRQQLLLNPQRQTQRVLASRWRQQQGDGFGQVTDGVIAFFKQPLGQPGVFLRQLAQYFGGHQLARFAARQKVHRPGCVSGRGALQIALQCGLFGQAGGGGVQFAVQGGKRFHTATGGEAASGAAGTRPVGAAA